MKLDNRDYSRDELLRRLGNRSQIGGTRHYILAEGRAKGVAAADFDTGAGLRFTVLPDRGLDITLASYKGTNLVYLTPLGESHPAFYEPQGMGWLQTFCGGLLTTCGLTYFAAPGRDGDQELGLHGRYSASPARSVCDLSDWDGDEYRLVMRGVVDEGTLFGDKVQLTRTISTQIGSRVIHIDDVAENMGHQPTPFTLLYHVNLGFPLLDESAELVLAAEATEPYDSRSAAAMGEMLRFSEPVPGCLEQNFLHRMAADRSGLAAAAIINRELAGGLGVYLRFPVAAFPYLNEWKMMGERDYVVAIEPSNAPLNNRAVLRREGTLPMLQPGERRAMNVEIGVLDGAAEIDQFCQMVKEIAHVGSNQPT